MCGDGSGYLVGAFGGHVDPEVEEFIDPALIFGCRAGEVGGRLAGEVFESGELGTTGAAFGVPGVELCEMSGEGGPLVVDLFEGLGELGIGDLMAVHAYYGR